MIRRDVEHVARRPQHSHEPLRRVTIENIQNYDAELAVRDSSMSRLGNRRQSKGALESVCPNEITLPFQNTASSIMLCPYDS